MLIAGHVGLEWVLRTASRKTTLVVMTFQRRRFQAGPRMNHPIARRHFIGACSGSALAVLTNGLSTALAAEVA
ncbi:MAG: hypothetical protein K8R23_17255 [Chthoniobacter sp.]|nr:hypothetical protein [Chthoniobacter sp.]